MSENYDPQDDIEKGRCSSCGKDCLVTIENFGIGPYHYGSEIGNEVKEVKLSSCCKAFLMEKNCE